MTLLDTMPAWIKEVGITGLLLVTLAWLGKQYLPVLATGFRRIHERLDRIIEILALIAGNLGVRLPSDSNANDTDEIDPDTRQVVKRKPRR